MKLKSSSLEIFSAKKLRGNAKATVQATGKIGFSLVAAELLELTKETGVIFGKQPGVSGYESLFIITVSGANKEAFPVIRVGNYYQIDVRNLLDLLNVQYKERSLIYNVSAVKDEDERKTFKLSLRREVKRPSRTPKERGFSAQ